METIGKRIMCFHIGRGGRFYNPGHKEFIGEMDLQELIYKRIINKIYIKDRDESGKFCKKSWINCSGHTVVDEEDFNSTTGIADFDGDYNRYICKKLEDCTEEEKDIIFKDTEDEEIKEWITNCPW